MPWRQHLLCCFMAAVDLWFTSTSISDDTRMGSSFIWCHLSPAHSSLQICISIIYVMNYKASTNERVCKCTFISSHNMRRNKSTLAIPLIRWRLNDTFTRSPPSWKKTGTRLFYVDIMAIDGLVVQKTRAPFQKSARSPKVVALFLLQTSVAMWYDFFNCMIQSKWNQIIQESTIIIII